MKRVVLSGYYGFGNLGDEAVLEAIIGAIREAAGEKVGFAVLSSSPDWTAERYGVEAVHRTHLSGIVRALRGSDLLISGGGSLLQDVTGPLTIPYYLGVIRLAQMLGVPTMIYAQGIGPIKRTWFHPLIRAVFKRARYISVRDPDSAVLLKQMGLNNPVETVADPVFALRPAAGVDAPHQAAEGFDGGRPIVVSLRPWPKVADQVLPALAGLLDRWVEKGERVCLMPMQETVDRPVLEALAGRMRHGRQLGWLKGDLLPSVQMGQIGRAKLVIGMRLHALIFAAAQGVPFVPISYDPKVDHLVKRLAYPLAALHAERLTPEALAKQADQALERLADLQTHLTACHPTLRQAALQPAQAVVRLLGLNGTT